MGGAQHHDGVGGRQPDHGAASSEPSPLNPKPPLHTAASPPVYPALRACDPAGEGDGGTHLRIFARGHPFPLGTAWREGQTEELTVFIVIWLQLHPGAAPGLAGSLIKSPGS